MIIIERWLKDWLEHPVATAELLIKLTEAGFESHSKTETETIEVDLTSNRGDCLSVLGFAREITAITGQKLKMPVFQNVQPTLTETIPIEILAPQDCPRYLGRIIRNLSLVKTPDFIQERLCQSGLTTVSCVVDVLNYVMLELGQPMHAFDLNMLSQKIIVRKALPQEKLMLLNEKTVVLTHETLVIADREKAIAIAGVMGGTQTRVSDCTTDVFLESAFFKPESVSSSARAYGLHTDAAYRFERGVDPELPKIALERATQLLISIAGGHAGPISEVSDSQYLSIRPEIVLSRNRISRLLGLDKPLEDAWIEKTFSALCCEHKPHPEGWIVKPPSFRFDMTCEEDCIEELARLYGYKNIPAKPLPMCIKETSPKKPVHTLSQICERLISRGYQEVITYSFIDPVIFSLMYPKHLRIELSNPISAQMAVMRPGLWPGLIKTLQYNQHRQQTRGRFFEIGLRFYLEPLEQKVIQEPMIGGLAFGALFPEQWGVPTTPIDFFDLKNDVLALCYLTQLQDEFVFVKDPKHPSLHPGQSAAIQFRGREVGYVGVLHPELLTKLEVTGPVVLFELELDVLLQTKQPKFRALPKCPSIRRDLALVLDRQQDAEAVVLFCKKEAGPLLQHVTIFDVYEGKNLPSGKKSLGLSFVLQDPDRTLLDEAVNNIMDHVVAKLIDHFGIFLRSS